MIDLAAGSSVTSSTRPRHAAPRLAAGLLGGISLGIVARAWMRLIANHPEFTWNGTLFIVLGFALFGVTQAVVAFVRDRGSRPAAVAAARVIGSLGMLPLFVAAGAVMLPTVVGGGLALAHPGWRRATRACCTVVAAGPVVLVAHRILDDFGWSLHSLAGIALFLVVYGIVVRTTRFTFEPSGSPWRPPRWITIASCVLLALLVLIPLIGGGIR